MLEELRKTLYNRLQRTEHVSKGDCDDYLKVMRGAFEEYLEHIRRALAGEPVPGPWFTLERLAQDITDMLADFDAEYPEAGSHA